MYALQALDIKPDDPEVLFILGKIYMKYNQSNEAIQHLEKAIRYSD